MADKSTRWQFTAYEAQYDSVDAVDKTVVAEIGWQDEVCPSTGRKHRQGFVRTHRQVRFSQLAKLLPGVHIEVARDWLALVNYCKKSATRDVSGSQIHKDFSKFAPPRLHDILNELADLLVEEGQWANKDRQTDRQTLVNEDPSTQYWRLTTQILYRKPELIGILGQPLPQNAWKHTRSVWIDKALERAETWQ